MHLPRGRNQVEATGPGSPVPLGVHWDGRGCNVAIQAGHADFVELCLFDHVGNESRIPLIWNNNGVWSAWIPGMAPGTLYGFRAHGPWDPDRGHRYNPNKLLMDPYARAMDGWLTYNPASFDHTGNPYEMSPLDNAPFMPRSVVVSPYFEWRTQSAPRTPLRDSIIYELHVKGFTKNHPAVPKNLRGTYSGLSHPAIIEYFLSLGVTAIELLPIHQFFDDHFLVEKGLTQYWGYQTVGFFAPQNSYAASTTVGGQVNEFKAMVSEYHRNGIEIILDVVFNHTGEANHDGPVVNFKGLDNRSYYWLDDSNRNSYIDFTGCGNTFDPRDSGVINLIADSLRYWAQEMRVDGFRFDLASTLARTNTGIQMAGPMMEVLRQDPVLRQVKLIAEPWDVGSDGYRLGSFPHPWSEWNGKFRDAMRQWWLMPGSIDVGMASRRVSGSQTTFGHNSRGPEASVNFITSHDGFTLKDLVSYNEKHNYQNLDDNSSGDNHNFSHNHGEEGATQDPIIKTIRRRQFKNLMATLMFSIGVPMLRMGDEIANTQEGNNNPYCVDGPISYVDWVAFDQDMFEFTKACIKFRKSNPIFSRKSWLRDTDVLWFKPDGGQFRGGEWADRSIHGFQMVLLGGGSDAIDSHCQPVEGKTLCLLYNASHQDLTYTLPRVGGSGWRVRLDTAYKLNGVFSSGINVIVENRSLVLLTLE